MQRRIRNLVSCSTAGAHFNFSREMIIGRRDADSTPKNVTHSQTTGFNQTGADDILGSGIFCSPKSIVVNGYLGLQLCFWDGHCTLLSAAPIA